MGPMGACTAVLRPPLFCCRLGRLVFLLSSSSRTPDLGRDRLWALCSKLPPSAAFSAPVETYAKVRKARLPTCLLRRSVSERPTYLAFEPFFFFSRGAAHLKSKGTVCRLGAETE